MPKYVALLRGIAPSNPNMHNQKLRAALESLGFSNVRSVISSGNLLFESPRTDTAALEAQIEAAWPTALGFTSTTIVRSLQELQALQAKNPFDGLTHNRQSYLNVTFLQHKPETGIQLPASSNYKVLAEYDREVCIAINTTLTKTPDYMLKAEKTYGKAITTRTWQTVQRIVSKFEQ